MISQRFLVARIVNPAAAGAVFPSKLFILLCSIAAFFAFGVLPDDLLSQPQTTPRFHDFYRHRVTGRMVMIEDIGSAEELSSRYLRIFTVINGRSPGVFWTLHKGRPANDELCVFYRSGQSRQAGALFIDFVIEPFSDFSRSYVHTDSVWTDMQRPPQDF